MTILIISAKSPQWSANLGYNTVMRKRKQGHEVDFLSKYAVESPEPWMHSVYPRLESTFNKAPKAQVKKTAKDIASSALISVKVLVAKAFHNLMFRNDYPDCNLKLFDESKPLVGIDDLIKPYPTRHTISLSPSYGRTCSQQPALRRYTTSCIVPSRSIVLICFL